MNNASTVALVVMVTCVTISTTVMTEMAKSIIKAINGTNAYVEKVIEEMTGEDFDLGRIDEKVVEVQVEENENEEKE